MKRTLVAAAALTLVVVAAAISGNAPSLLPLSVKVEDRNPWSHLRLNNGSETFQFAIVSDRTGGHRAKIFSRAVEQLNLLQPEFVLSVGDLIEGGSTQPDKINAEWREFQGYVARLEMPFFYVGGNHDLSNKVQEGLWQEKFGRRYYHFVYKNVLFLMLCSEDPAGSSKVSPEQIAYVKRALDENPSVSWTIAALHKPIWANKDLDKNGWLEVEKLLADRPYTVFAGHVHRYEKFVRQGRNYYQLATTGGGSRLRGLRYGEFDHVVWVTMRKDGPVLANIMLDGIYPENLRTFDSEETAHQTERKATQPAKGKVYLDGCPAVGSMVAFHLKGANDKFTHTADAIVEADGNYVLSTYVKGDGAPVGTYAVTVTPSRYHPIPEGRSRSEAIPPEVYSKPETSPLRVEVKPGPNDLTIQLTQLSEVEAAKK